MNKQVIATAIVAAVSAFAFIPASGALAATAAAAPAATAQAPVVIAMTVLTDDGGGLKGSDGKTHDTMIPANAILQKGVPVTLQVTSHDDMMHTITAPGLGLNVMVKPAKKVNGQLVPTVTTVTFTPTKTGQFRWHCLGGCDPWTMQAGFDGPDRDGFMAGYFVVL
jgi:heme/copper-type cytochrome/quinol oxidase subunit 2